MTEYEEKIFFYGKSHLQADRYERTERDHRKCYSSSMTSSCFYKYGIFLFNPPDTELLRALHFRNSKNIRNPLIFLQKMASYSCFGRGPRS